MYHEISHEGEEYFLWMGMGLARRSNHSEFQPRFIITFRAGFLLGIQASCA